MKKILIMLGLSLVITTASIQVKAKSKGLKKRNLQKASDTSEENVTYPS